MTLALIVNVELVQANNFGGPLDSGKHCNTSLQSQCVANDSTHLVCITAVTAPHRSATVVKIGHYDSMSFLYATENPAPCNNADDVIVKDVNLPGTGAIAWGKCAAGASTGGSETPLPGTKWCKAQEFIWDRAFDYLIDSDSDKYMVACHELGHTLGLRHTPVGNYTCMVPSTISPVYINPWGNTDAHDRVKLDERYSFP